MTACEAIKYIGDAGYFRLVCSLEKEDHPDAMHWDPAYELVWAPWTYADEREFREAIGEHAPGDAVGGHGARGEPGTGPHEPTETAADRPEQR